MRGEEGCDPRCSQSLRRAVGQSRAAGEISHGSATLRMPWSVVKPKRSLWPSPPRFLSPRWRGCCSSFRTKTRAALGSARGESRPMDRGLALREPEPDKDNAFFTDGVQDGNSHRPFENRRPESDQPHVGDAIRDEPPRNLREIGQQLGVARVVEGSVQRAANNSGERATDRCPQ